jgi:hypothetical protein
MNYQKIYESLINKRRDNPAKGYTERHHILPRALGGSDDPTNLVVLSGREHWVAHLLLHKIHRKNQTLFACHMMAIRCEERGIPYIKNSRMYEAIRIEYAKRIGQYTSKCGELNSQYGTKWICNIELKQNKKIKKDTAIPNGWILGRNKWNLSNRTKLEKCISITNGKTNKRLFYTDQVIPEGWYIGTVSYLDENSKKKISTAVSASNKNRTGLKYKKYQ